MSKENKQWIAIGLMGISAVSGLSAMFACRYNNPIVITSLAAGYFVFGLAGFILHHKLNNSHE